jgi:hypothetical protein
MISHLHVSRSFSLVSAFVIYMLPCMIAQSEFFLKKNEENHVYNKLQPNSLFYI